MARPHDSEIPEWFDDSLLERRNHFFGIGINTYSHVMHLNNAKKDVQDVANLLIEDYRFEKELVYILADLDATSHNILIKLREYVRRLDQSDNLILYFSGHGVKDSALNEGFWIPVEGEGNDFSTWIPNCLVIRMIEAMNAHHVFLIVDACFSGSLFRFTPSNYNKYDRAPSRFALTSGALEIVRDGEPGRNSPFAGRLLDGLRQHEKSYLLATELTAYVKGGSFQQKPLAHSLHIDGYMEGEFVFYRREDAWTKDERAFDKAKEEDTEQAYLNYIEACSKGELVGNFKEDAEKAMKEAGDRRIWNRIKSYPSLYDLRTFILRDTAFKEEAQELYNKLKKLQVPLSELDITPAPFTVSKPLIPEMVRIESFSFEMGSRRRNKDEKPAHDVVLASFEIAKYPVTQRQWEAIMGSNPSEFKGESLPVENVSWRDCQAFIKKLNEKTGLIFRLPSEAEWEGAAGGEANNRMRWAGTDDAKRLKNYAWYGASSLDCTQEVGKLLPNAFGLYDICGNVWEWCADWYDEGYYSVSPLSNPKGPDSGDERVIRGGSWQNKRENFCRVSFRNHNEPNHKGNYLGFRLARSVR